MIRNLQNSIGNYLDPYRNYGSFRHGVYGFEFGLLQGLDQVLEAFYKGLLGPLSVPQIVSKSFLHGLQV